MQNEEADGVVLSEGSRVRTVRGEGQTLPPGTWNEACMKWGSPGTWEISGVPRDDMPERVHPANQDPDRAGRAHQPLLAKPNGSREVTAVQA